MDAESAIRSEIATIEEATRPFLTRLAALNRALDALSDTLVCESQTVEARAEPSARHTRTKSETPPAWLAAVDVLAPEGRTFSDFRSAYALSRGKDISENTFAAQLSKMKGNNLIHKREDRWFAGPQKNEPGADLLAETPGSSVPSDQETAHAENNT